MDETKYSLLQDSPVSGSELPTITHIVPDAFARAYLFDVVAAGLTMSQALALAALMEVSNE